jgi:hypothetical protein
MLIEGSRSGSRSGSGSIPLTIGSGSATLLFEYGLDTMNIKSLNGTSFGVRSVLLVHKIRGSFFKDVHSVQTF